MDTKPAPREQCQSGQILPMDSYSRFHLANLNACHRSAHNHRAQALLGASIAPIRIPPYQFRQALC